MHNGIEIIVHHRDGSGAATCSAYAGLGLSNPVMIVLGDYDSAQSHAHQLNLFQALEAEIIGSLGGRAITPPCRGRCGDLGSCHARGDANCQKILVLVGDDHSPATSEITSLSDEWAGAVPGYAILPVFPAISRLSVSALLPASAQTANAEFWMSHPREALPALFAFSSITAKQSKLFISYRQIDTAALAIQLFDALSHEGFDVFLDHFRIPPGVNFQARLTQELGDKSMVLLLESANLGQSQWVAHEISIAKSCGLGLLGLLLPGGQRQPSLDEGDRQIVDQVAFVGGAFSNTATLTPNALGGIVARIKTLHDRVLIGRRRILRQSFELALQREGCGNVQRLGNGAFRVQAAGKEYLVWLTPRPPDTPDFYDAHGAAAPSRLGVVVGLSRLMEPDRAVRTKWLADLCTLKLVDEGQLSQLARDIAGGIL